MFTLISALLSKTKTLAVALAVAILPGIAPPASFAMNAARISTREESGYAA